MSVTLLEQQADRCIRLARECQSPRAETVMRLLAVDLMLAAEAHRRQTKAARRRAANDDPVPADPFAELELVMRAVTFMRLPDMAVAMRREPIAVA